MMCPRKEGRRKEGGVGGTLGSEKMGIYANTMNQVQVFIVCMENLMDQLQWKMVQRASTTTALQMNWIQMKRE